MKSVFIYTAGILVIGFLFRVLIFYYSEYKQLKEELAKQKRNTAYLATHAKEMAKIEADSREIERNIKEAKNEEEIADIINTIIDSNNERVAKLQDNK